MKLKLILATAATALALPVSALAAAPTITTIAGTGDPGFSGDGGPATAAQIQGPIGTAALPDGSVLFVDAGNARIRRISPTGVISTFAGNGQGGTTGDGGPATAATLSGPYDLAVEPDGSVLIASSNNDVRRVDPQGIISTPVPGLGAALGIVAGANGEFFVGGGNQVRRVSAAGVVTPFAGTGSGGSSGDGGPATAAQLSSVYGLAYGPDGSVFVADLFNSRVRRVAPDGTISTVAGTGTAAETGDGGPATAAELNGPFGLDTRPNGNLIIVDIFGNRVREVDSAGTITTLAGDGTRGFAGDGGPATEAEFNQPTFPTVLADGSVVLGDFSNQRVRRISPTGPATVTSDPAPGDVTGGTPPELSISLSRSDLSFGSLRPFESGPLQTYSTTTQATVRSTAAAVSVSVLDSDPSGADAGYLVNTALRPDGTATQRYRLTRPLSVVVGGNALPLTQPQPVGTDELGAASTAGQYESSFPVTLQQQINPNEGLRTGVYKKTIAFVASATTP